VRPPDDKRIRRWYERVRETGSVEKKYSVGRLGDLIKMRIVLGGLPHGVRRSRSPEQGQSSRCRKRKSTELFGGAYV
jgi:hypothetical protein